MRLKHVRTIIMLSGALLIVVGLALTIDQFWLQFHTDKVIPVAARKLGIGAAGAEATLETTYVGLVPMVLGVFLEIVGYIAGRPWKSEGGELEGSNQQGT